MRTTPKQAIALTFVAAAAVVSLAACKGGSSGSASASATASTVHSAAAALASSTAGQAVKHDFEHCIPADGVSQVKLLRQLLADTRKHPNGAWQAFFTCVGITQANQQPFENDMIKAIETGHLITGGSAARATFRTTTFPAIVAKYANQAAASAASAVPSPTVTQ
jgi:hypothetical protein